MCIHSPVPMSDRGEIGKRVREARQLAGLRVKHVADACNRMPNTVYRWEQGRKDPCLADARTIAQLCGVSYAWLLTGEGCARAA